MQFTSLQKDEIYTLKSDLSIFSNSSYFSHILSFSQHSNKNTYNTDNLEEIKLVDRILSCNSNKQDLVK